MSQDAEIRIRFAGDVSALNQRLAEVVNPVRGVDGRMLGVTVGAYPGLPADMTHIVYNPWRFYEPGDSRGCWPEICAVLLVLMTFPGVERVRYGGEYWAEDSPQADVTPARLMIYTNAFLKLCPACEVGQMAEQGAVGDRHFWCGHCECVMYSEDQYEAKSLPGG